MLFSMSEFINNRASRPEALADFTRELIKGGNGKTLITKLLLNFGLRFLD